jgi:Na+-driven multidrug efflux pump
MPAFGVNNGVIAITAFNYGAKNKSRINSSIQSGLLYALCIMVAGTALIQAFAPFIVSLFDASEELMSAGIMALRIISLSYAFAAFTFAAQGIYQALDSGIYSLIITLMRIVVVLLPALYIFARFFELNQVWWAFVAAEGFSALTGAFLLYRIYHQKIASMETTNK